MSSPENVTPPTHNETNIAPRFCVAEGCGLTVAPGAARCWIHKPAGPQQAQPAGPQQTQEGHLR